MEKKGMSAGDDELILALAAGASEREAAEQAGISEQTVYRRLADADFRQAVNEVQGQMFDAARGQLASLTGKATETLARLLESDKPSVALAAAKAVLELGPRLRRSADLEEEINRLEDGDADEKTEGDQPSAGDDELVRALAAGASVREAAEQAGVEERTAQGRLADADFRRAVSRARGRLLHAAVGRLAKLASKATSILERLLESDQPSVARRAAKAVLALGPKLRDSSEIDERISRLEERPKREPKCEVVMEGGWYLDRRTKDEEGRKDRYDSK